LTIAGAETIERLRQVREEEQNRLREALPSSPVIELTRELNELHDRLIASALRLAEDEAARQGLGAPPVPYAYLLFGSGGRSEQTMSSDQDSGLVYEDPSGAEQAERTRSYFRRFAETAALHLTELGYPPCEGNVVAANPEWCLSESEWERKLNDWFEEPSWEHVRYLLIVADGRPVYGDGGIAERWRARFGRDVADRPVIGRRMMENTLRHKALVGVFGQLLTERYGETAGSIDIKYGAYLPMVNIFRLLAVRAGLRETSTLGRIRALREAGLLSEPEEKEATEAFALFLELRLLAVEKEEQGLRIGTGKFPANRLTKGRKRPLKKALRLARKLQRRLERELRSRFGGGEQH
jgi:CBS domain-containing protein